LVGDPLVRPTRPLAQFQDPLVPGLEVLEGSGDQLGVHVLQDGVLDVVGTGIAGPHDRFVERGRAGAPTEYIGAQVAGDDGQPGVEPSISGEGGEGPPRPGERLLDDVLGL
jgi:hypothetical protein